MLYIQVKKLYLCVNICLVAKYTPTIPKPKKSCFLLPTAPDSLFKLQSYYILILCMP